MYKQLSDVNQLEYTNKRNFVRFNALLKLEATLQICIGDLGNHTLSKPTNVVIKDISANGVAFLSDLAFPISDNQDIYVKISFTLMNNYIERIGKLVRFVHKGKPFKYMYGFSMVSTEKDEDDLYKVLLTTGRKFEKVNFKNSSMWSA